MVDRLLARVLPALEYPVALYPIPTDADLRLQVCPHCSNESGTSVWDIRRGFLVRCPHCDLLFGKRWNVRSRWRWIFLLFLNFLGFFLTMRPRVALPFSTLGLLYWVVGGLLHDYGLLFDGADEVPFFVVGVFVPWLINIAVILRHEIDLDDAERKGATRTAGNVGPSST